MATYPSHAYQPNRSENFHHFPLHDIGQLIRERREQANLSRASLALRAGISASTLKNLEIGRHQPTRTTLFQLCAVPELKLNLSDLLLDGSAREAEAGPPLNCWLAPGFDPIAMAHDLTTRLSGRGGHIEQTFLYLDTKSAACWCAYVSQPDYAALRESLPLREAANKIYECVGGAGLDVIGLGCGDGKGEVRLAQLLLQQADPGDLRLYLLDISQPLLGFAYKYAADTLADHRGVAVFAIQGDFHRLPCYTQLLYTPQRAHRRRVVCMFGWTFGNLENEIRFVRNSLVGFAPGDLLLLDVGLVYAPSDRADEIRRRDPRLSGALSSGRQALEREWLIGPFERYARPAGAPLSEQEIHSVLDQTSCTVPGSYAVERIITVRSTDGEVRKFSTLYVKRYDGDKLVETLRSLGWDPVCGWPSGNLLRMYLFRWRG